MSAFTLKLIALGSMLYDHLTALWYIAYPAHLLLLALWKLYRGY